MRVCPIRIGPLSNWSRIRVGRRVEAGGRRREEATSIHWRFNEKQQRNCSAQRAEFPYSVLALAVKPACRSLRSMLNSGCNLFAVVYPTSSWDRSNPRDTPRTSVSLSPPSCLANISGGISTFIRTLCTVKQRVSLSLSLSPTLYVRWKLPVPLLSLFLPRANGQALSLSLSFSPSSSSSSPSSKLPSRESQLRNWALKQPNQPNILAAAAAAANIVGQKAQAQGPAWIYRALFDKSFKTQLLTPLSLSLHLSSRLLLLWTGKYTATIRVALTRHRISKKSPDNTSTAHTHSVGSVGGELCQQSSSSSAKIK